MCGGSFGGDALRIRRAEPDDVPALYAMLERCAADLGTPEGISADADDWRRDGFGAHPRFSSLIAESADEPVGMATYTELYLSDIGRAAYYVLQLYVEPAHRRHGIGRALLRRVACAAVAADIPVVLVGTVHLRPSANVYLASGFVKAERYATYFLFGEQLSAVAAR